MNIKTMLAAATLATAASASFGVTCTQTFNSLGTMGPPATKALDGNSFSSNAAFSDCYNFSLSAAANASGTTSESNAYKTAFGLSIVSRYIDVLTVSLFHDDAGNSTQVSLADWSPSQFSFSDLTAGAYKLVVAGYSLGLSGTASYSGTLSTTAVAAPVPEPGLLALMGLALAGATVASRRRQGKR